MNKKTLNLERTQRVLRFEESFKASTLLLSRNFTRGGSQAETLISLLRTDQYTSSVRI